jgi:5-methylcytosine-specific restriction endonuclease McrA
MFKHGTRGGYVNHKCRCGQCAEANRIYKLQYYAVPAHAAARQIYRRAHYQAHRDLYIANAQRWGRVWRAANPDLQRARTAAWSRANPDRIRALGRKHAQIRRARKAEAFKDAVDLAVLIVRDGGRCQLCGKKIRAKKGMRGPSTDHIIPVSLGGEHSYANTQLAHLECNKRKNNRVFGDGEQLRLI